MTNEMKRLLEEMVERRASDLHITPGVPPQLRIDGTLIACDHTPLDPTSSREYCMPGDFVTTAPIRRASASSDSRSKA